MNICTLQSLNLYSNNFIEGLPSILSNLSGGCVRHSLKELDLSWNHITGTLSDISVLSSLKKLFLDGNRLSGTIPEDVKLPSTLERFSIIANFFQGGIPNFILFRPFIQSVIRTYYRLLETIEFTIVYLDLSHNNFSGKIPTSMELLLDLQALLLRNNNLVEGIPFSLRNCTMLVMLDMSENKLSGSLPDWIGTNEELEILSLGKKQLCGSLPLEVCCLKNIRVLDLSMNNLSGKIPKCIQNLTSMANIEQIHFGDRSNVINDAFYKIGRPYYLNALLTWKGSKQITDEGLSLLKNLDLSSNHFSEEIPVKIEKLSGLISLNLSRNNLTGKIPPNIGKLTLLDSLDLSRNRLVGSIPPSLAQIYGLGVLDVSHNRLSGEIPTCTQLQSFSTSSYEDNFGLCGPPLKKLCIEGGFTQEPNIKVYQDKYSLFNNGFFISMTFGFVVSFTAVFGSILFRCSS